MFNLKFALRTLFKAPFLATVAICSLALGIGANVAIFSLFDEVLVRPLPVQDPGHLVNLSAPGPKPGNQTCNQSGDCDTVFTYPMYRDLEQAQTVFEGLAAHRIFAANVAAHDQTVNGDAALVSGSYFPVLGLHAAMGRLIMPAEDATLGGAPVTVLAHAFWESQFGSDPNVLGQTVTVNGHGLSIIGVAPRGFDGTTLGTKPMVFVPLTMRDVMQSASGPTSIFANRRSYWLYLFARLKPGVSIDQARAAMNVPYRAILNDVEAPLQVGLSDQGMARFRARTIEMEAGAHGQTSQTRGARMPLTLLFGVTTFVLLIACANIANLLLARSAARSGEMAIRLSIGASRRHLIAQLLLESCLLALLGGVAGMLVAHWTLDGISSMMPAQVTRTIALGLDWQATAFAAALTLGTGLLFGLFPALHTTRPNLASTLKNQAGQPSGGRSAARFRTSLATVQIAMSMALLVSAGLFTKSLANISRVNLGVKIDNLITFAVSPGLSGYTPALSLDFFTRLEDQLAAYPGVTSVTDTIVPLLADNSSGSDLNVEGFTATPDTDANARFNGVGTDYFHTFGTPVIAGREFTRADVGGASKVAIVNEAFARKFHLGQNVVGKHIGYRNGPSTSLDMEIVGLAADAKYNQVKDAVPAVFVRPYREIAGLRSLTFYVRTAGDPAAFLANIQKLVTGLDANLPVENLRTMPEQVRENVFLDRFVTVLSAAFAVLATLLAAIGLYGVLAYTVALRTREIGLRMALGADAARVRWMILRHVGMMTLVGGGIGLAVAIAIGRVSQSLLYELQGSDPGVLAAAAVALGAVAAGAGFIPARRASRVDPMRALRYE